MVVCFLVDLLEGLVGFGFGYLQGHVGLWVLLRVVEDKVSGVFEGDC